MNYFKNMNKHIFLFFLIYCNCALADVFPLMNAHGHQINITQNGQAPILDQFMHIANLYLQDIDQHANQHFQNPFEQVNPQPNWQLPALGAFVRDGAQEPSPVFVAKKRTNNPINNDVFNHDNLLGVHNPDVDFLQRAHTEKQILRQILLDVPENTQGTAFIFTLHAPCQGNHADNGHFPCTTHYNRLAERFPHVIFHIYFKITSIEPNALLNNNELLQNLFHYINNLLQGIQPTNPVHLYFCSTGIPLTLQFISGNWTPINNDSPNNLKFNFVGKVNTWLQRNANLEQKMNLFNNVYNHQNVHYHIIG